MKLESGQWQINILSKKILQTVEGKSKLTGHPALRSALEGQGAGPSPTQVGKETQQWDSKGEGAGETARAAGPRPKTAWLVHDSDPEPGVSIRVLGRGPSSFLCYCPLLSREENIWGSLNCNA